MGQEDLKLKQQAHEQSKLVNKHNVDIFPRKELNENKTLDGKIDNVISPLGTRVGRLALLIGAATLLSTVIAPPLAPILLGVTSALVGATVAIATIHNIRQLTGGNNKPQPINESLLEDRLAKQDIPAKQPNLDKTKEKSKGHEISQGIEPSIDNIKLKAPNRERSLGLRNNNEVNKTVIVKSKELQTSKGREHL